MDLVGATLRSQYFFGSLVETDTQQVVENCSVVIFVFPCVFGYMIEMSVPDQVRTQLLANGGIRWFLFVHPSNVEVVVMLNWLFNTIIEICRISTKLFASMNYPNSSK